MADMGGWKKCLWEETKKSLTAGSCLFVYDTETTGLSPERDKVIEIGIYQVIVNPDYSVTVVDKFHRYINQGVPLPPVITDLTGITDELLAGAPDEDEVFADLIEFWGAAPVVSGYNIRNFDNKFMAELYARHGLKFEPKAVIDGIELARNRLVKDKDVPNYKLGTCAEYYGIEFDAHSAIEDACATTRLIEQFFKEYHAEEELEGTHPEPKNLLKPKVLSASYWEGYRGYPRVYFNTTAGSVYYDVRGHQWGGKPPCDISTLDMEWLSEEACRLLAPETLKSFRGQKKF